MGRRLHTLEGLARFMHGRVGAYQPHVACTGARAYEGECSRVAGGRLASAAPLTRVASEALGRVQGLTAVV